MWVRYVGLLVVLVGAALFGLSFRDPRDPVAFQLLIASGILLAIGLLLVGNHRFGSAKNRE
jgi:hypothetical protein